MILTRKEIIERARNGDPAAWEEIIADHGEGVFRYAFLKLGNVQEAEEVAQETFVRAFRYLDRFDDDRPLRPWLLSISANLARNRWRSFARYRAAIQRLVERRPGSPMLQGDLTPARADPIKWRARRLREAVEQLSKSDRDVLYLRYFLDLSVTEAAQVLEVAEGTVKSRSHRAIVRLRELIMKDFPDLVEDLLP